MIKKLHITWIKYRLRKLIYKFNNDYVFYQCGNDVLDTITGGRYSRDKQRIAKIKQTLKRINPNYPKGK